MKKKLLFIIIGCLLTQLIQAQTIRGTVIDAQTNEALIGVGITLVGTSIGTTTDVDGNYILRLPSPNTPYGLKFSYVSYETKLIEGIKTSADSTIVLNITLNSSTQDLKEVVVTGTMRRESVAALLAFQKNNVAVSDVMAGDIIRRNPDRNTGEILKRVSGTTLEGGRFVTIRGLNDRYNLAMINGTLLPSTEPDRRAFAFDLLPSLIIDNLIITKTATSDFPSEFSGGIIQVQTKEVPENRFLNLQIGTAYHALTTFQPYYHDQQAIKGIGLNLQERQLPADFPDYVDSNDPKVYEYTQKLSNTWAIEKSNMAVPALNIQLAGGFNQTMGEHHHLGLVAALTYNNAIRNSFVRRQNFDVDGQRNFEDNDQQSIHSRNTSALVNVRYVLHKNNKINYQTNFTANTNDQTTYRTGENRENNLIRSYANSYNATFLQTHQLGGEHYLPKSNIKIQWNGNYTQTQRHTPDSKQLQYFRSLDNTDDSTYLAQVATGSATLDKAGRFYGKLMDNTYGGRLDVSVPYRLLKQAQTLKVGVFNQTKYRQFDARALGMVYNSPFLFQYDLLQSSPDSIFAAQHINANGFKLNEITSPSDQYQADRTIWAMYAMTDFKITPKWRTILGVRMEQSQQHLVLYNSIGEDSTYVQQYVNLLPSLNIVYKLNEQSNMRFAAAKTISRPEFRELSAFAFYDFETRAIVIGNPNLRQAYIWNIDLRYELFAKDNQTFSVSAFYKRFNRPIEQVFTSSGAGSLNRSFNNAQSAANYGIETECRKNFGFVHRYLEPLTLSLNLAYIYANVKIDSINTLSDRPLQGQSPYIINTNINYNWSKAGMNITLLYNRIGRRIVEVGSVVEGFPDIYENPRHLLDLAISKQCFKKANIRLSCNDILAQPILFYQDIDQNHSYNEAKDNLITQEKQAPNISLSFNYRF
ncbi:MAG: TonB-dependent receptor [Chitinophagales bacterium]|nr:TonB-dependent receptor [Chitinophagales bacterium]